MTRWPPCANCTTWAVSSNPYNVDSVSVPHCNNTSSCWLPSPLVSPAIAIEMSPPDMIAMFDNVQNEEYNTPVSIVNRASNEGMQRPLPDLQILKAAQRSLCQHPNFVLCLTCVLNVRHFQPREGPTRGLLHDCEIFVNLHLYLQLAVTQSSGLVRLGQGRSCLGLISLISFWSRAPPALLLLCSLCRAHPGHMVARLSHGLPVSCCTEL